MRRILNYYTFLAVLFAVVKNASAIATADQAASEAPPSDAGYSLNWDYVYKCNNSTAVAVDHYWVLTAAHVADDSTGNLQIGGTTYYQVKKVFHASADLALIKYDKPLPGYYLLNEGNIYTYVPKGRSVIYDTLLMVGYGFAGTVSSSSFTQGSGAGVKRWGTNQGGSTISPIYDNVSKTTQAFYMAFNSGATSHEAGANIYDSGGPVFVESNSVWRLTGINLYRTGADPNFTGNWAAFIPDYIGWIKSVITDYDTDMDQLPDWWENQYFPATGTTSTADSDGDGQNNLAEFYAGTDPTNSSDFFALDLAVTNNLGTLSFAVTFPVITNRTYTIEKSATLQVDSWVSLTNLTTDTVGTIEFLDPVDTAPDFYRVHIGL